MQSEHTKLLTRRRLLIALGGAAIAAAGNGIILEPRRLSITRSSIDSPGSSAADPVMRVVQITDLHLQRISRHVQRIASTTNRLKPQLIVMTGDMIDRRERLPELGRFLELLDDGPVKLAVLGNWEHWAHVDMEQLATTYSDRACRLLVNETVRFRFQDRDVVITGFDDATGGRPHLGDALHNVVPAANHIVLAHSPAFRDAVVAAMARGPMLHDGDAALAKYSIACVLSGHTHGGQVAPFGWAPFRPPGSGRYLRGWYRDASPPLYVSRGLGTSMLPIRFGAVPELAMFDWRLSSALQHDQQKGEVVDQSNT